MADHIHAWKFDQGGAIVCRLHSNGIWVMNLDDAERRLNATERLSAESPIGVGVDEQGGWGEYVAVKREDWTAYISALEGEDDLSKLTTQQKLTEEDMDAAR